MNGPAIAVEILSTRTTGKRGGHRIAVCRCGCGKEFEAALQKVKAGHTKSCGCFSRAIAKNAMTTHGMRNTREYKIWCGMKTRCLNPNYIKYSNYGGRGISICDAWKDSFQQFFEDMGKCPDGMSIERTDTNGNYEPSNCVWATDIAQARNKRTSLNVEFDGVMISIKELADRNGIKYPTLRHRIVNMGMSPAKAVSYER